MKYGFNTKGTTTGRIPAHALPEIKSLESIPRHTTNNVPIQSAAAEMMQAEMNMKNVEDTFAQMFGAGKQ